jgi:lon-related putative ATP-dependent protease
MAEVPIAQLRPTCDPESFAFQTTAELEPYVGLIGQTKAIDALKFGVAIDSPGFNIVVSGEPGTGRTTAIREYLEEVSRGKPPADEWLYVNNFADPHLPRALRLPPGKGREFQRGMADLIAEARDLIPRTFESEDYVNRRDQIVGSVQRHREQVFGGLAERAREAGFLLQGNPAGFFLVPLAEDKPMDDQAFMALEPEARAQLLRKRDELMEELKPLARQGQTGESEAAQRLSELQRTVAQNVVDALVDRFFVDYEEQPDIIQYLLEVRRDMIDNIQAFQRPPETPQPQQPQAPFMPVSTAQRELASPFRKYEVNLLVDCSSDDCAKVVFESNPSPQRLIGRIEKEAVFGAITTDFTMIQAGSLHRANGGYLVFDFDDMLSYPLTWNELKRTIRTGHITIEEMGDRLGYIETKTVRPEPIPWTGKIVAIARESIYRTLYSLDPDFRELFKVKANFDMRIDRTPENIQAYAGLIASVTQREGLPPLDRGAVARIVDEGARMASDQSKLSIRFGDITDIVREAAHWATAEGVEVVNGVHVSRAVEEREARVNLMEENLQEAIEKSLILVDTEGEEVGQVNGLSVMDVGDDQFGQPSRITATAGVGQDGVIDLQREALLGGPIHTKAVLTLQGFLVDRYATETPLSLTSRISFEQSYGLVEGDSATCAEVCALVSRLAEAPVRQSLAITGSMDQHGEVQAIGGVNEKIEGFFQVCKSRGLTGSQGVIIPQSNVQQLMLREDVVRAVQEGRFQVHAVSTIDEAVELLMGIPSGEKGPDGRYPEESINGMVQSQLTRFAVQLKAFSLHHGG